MHETKISHFRARRFHEIFLIFVLQFDAFAVYSLSLSTFFCPLCCIRLFSPVTTIFGCNVHCAKSYGKRILSFPIPALSISLQCHAPGGRSDLVFWLSLMMVLFLSSSSPSLQSKNSTKEAPMQKTTTTRTNIKPKDNCIAARIRQAYVETNENENENDGTKK